MVYPILILPYTQLRKIIRAVRGSPQRRQAWLKEVTISLEAAESALKVVALMLILDVKTRWYSTHQMLRMFRISEVFPLY